MLSTGYQSYNYAEVTNFADFYKSNLPEISKVRSLIEGIKLLLSIPGNCIRVYVAEGERVYKFVVLDSNVSRIPIGYFVYIPLGRRLDIYTMENPEMPLIQWQGKKVVHKMYSSFFDKLGFPGLFTKLVNII